jgi:hypothetical protein
VTLSTLVRETDKFYFGRQLLQNLCVYCLLLLLTCPRLAVLCSNVLLCSKHQGGIPFEGSLPAVFFSLSGSTTHSTVHILSTPPGFVPIHAIFAQTSTAAPCTSPLTPAHYPSRKFHLGLDFTDIFWNLAKVRNTLLYHTRLRLSLASLSVYLVRIMQQQQDVWMHPSEEARFNIFAQKWNLELMPLIETDNYLSAFFHVQRRFNNMIPDWATGPASQFVDLVHQKWTSLASNDELIQEKYAIVIGAARRICSLQLQMEPGSSNTPGYIEMAQRRGLLFHIRDYIPSPNAYVLTRYDSQDAWERIEALEQISIISTIFASVGGVAPSKSEEHFHFDPYFTRPPPTKKFPAVERRRSTNLAYVALHARHARSHQEVKAPFRLLSQIMEGSGSGNFSEEDLADQAAVTDEVNPLRPTLAYLAGKLLQCKHLGDNVSESKSLTLDSHSWILMGIAYTQKHHRFDTDYKCQLQRRHAAVSLISPFLLFLKTGFKDEESPKGPTYYQVRNHVTYVAGQV